MYFLFIWDFFIQHSRVDHLKVLYNLLAISDSSYSVGKNLNYLNSLEKVMWLSVYSN